MFLSCSFEPHRLRHVDLLFMIAMEKAGLHIELIKLQHILCHQCQQNLNRQVLHNGREYLVVFNAFSLHVAFSYQSGFVVYSITIGRSLFFANTHLQPIAFFTLGNSDNSQVSFLYRELISFIMASFHILTLN